MENLASLEMRNITKELTFAVISRYKVWCIQCLLNRIPKLISNDNFDRSDELLKKANTIFEELPASAKKNTQHIEDLIIEMRKLLGSEFRRKLNKQLHEEKSPHTSSKHSAPVTKPSQKIFALQQKITVWKKQGYDTALLEKELHQLKK